MIESRPVRAAVAAYDLMLRCYPHAFRERFGDEMREVFAAMCRDADATTGTRGVLAVCAETVVDVIRSAPCLRWRVSVQAMRAGARSGDLVAALANRLLLSVLPLLVIAKSLTGGPSAQTMAVPVLCALVLHCAVVHAVLGRAGGASTSQRPEPTRLPLQVAIATITVLTLRSPDAFLSAVLHDGSMILRYSIVMTLPVCIVLAATSHARGRLGLRGAAADT